MEALCDIAIRLFGTHRNNPDASEVFAVDRITEKESGTDTTPNEEPTGDDTEVRDGDDDSVEWVSEETGEISLTKPTRLEKARNDPGAAATAQKWAIEQFRGVPNAVPRKGASKGKKGATMFRRCASPDRFWGDCPQPFNPDRFGTGKPKGKGKRRTWGEREECAFQH